MKAGVLTIRDVGSWWLAVPGAGLFVKSFLAGRKYLLNAIKKSKMQQVLQQVVALSHPYAHTCV